MATSIPLRTTISHLESIAESLDPPTNTQTTHSEPSASGRTEEAATSSQLDNRRKRRSTKSTNRKDAKKNKTSNDIPPNINIANIQAMKKTPVELRFLAEKHAQTGMSQAVFHSILKFHKEMETLIAIKALELGTTVSVIEEIFGEAMRALSTRWAEMDKTEKESYRKVSYETSIINETVDQELAELDFGPQARNEIMQPRTSVLANPRCNKTSKVAAKRLLDDTLAKCIPVAKTHHFEMVIIAISCHIAKHNFQLTRNTIGLDKALDIIYTADGDKALPVQLQSYLVGKTPQSLRLELETSGRKFQSRVVHSLSDFLYETTKLKHWPWSNCDKVLADAGYELNLLPGARTLPSTLKTSSNYLNQAKLVALEQDLKEHLIHANISPNGINEGRDLAADTLDNNCLNDILNQTYNFTRVNTNIIERRSVDPALFAV
ncbi:hypothetical protein DFH28DRAFT_1079218 [Melampsora americana]|nr:hypothetical protein DFH28DRAFT_1079218 [Melampsora americana]